jgi:prephenate dehydratase
VEPALPSNPSDNAVANLVAIQGEPGSFSHEAALILAPLARIVPCTRSAEVFRALVEGSVGAAVIPIENSLAGSVLEHYDLLLQHPVCIHAEHLLRIRHNLIAAPGAELEELREVYSHPIALDQCRGLFRQHPHLRPTSFYDTAGSVQHILSANVAAGPAQAGAIASRQAALQYGGAILLEGIEDNQENYTRFLLLRAASVSGQDERWHPGTILPPNKVSLCFAVENRPGSLVEALQAFASHRINLTRLESRPVPGSPWNYVFYTDYELDGLNDLGKADAALADLVLHCSMVKELGRYRAAAR